MEDHIVSNQKIEEFRMYLTENEKSDATVRKYVREIKELQQYLAGEPIAKGKVIEYRKILQEKHQATTVNGKLSAINRTPTAAVSRHSSSAESSCLGMIDSGRRLPFTRSTI